MIEEAGHRATASRRRGTVAMRGAVLAWAGLFSVAVLTGCAPAKPDFSHGLAPQLQASVAAVTGSAAAGQPGQAIAELDALQAQLKEATASGSVSAARSARIQASIDLVRADLISVLPAPSPASEPAPAPEPDPAPDESAPGTQPRGNQGNGNDNGNGNKDKDKGNKDKGKDD